jgi:formylglycine-generating enzyme required for sulfatase activity
MRTLLAPFLLVFLIGPPTLSSAPIQQGEIQKLEKQIADLAKRIEREEAQINKQKPGLEKVFRDLKSEAGRAAFAAALKPIETNHREPTSTGSAAAAEAMTKATREIVKKSLGASYDEIFGGLIASNLLELFQGNLDPGSDILSVVKESVEDLFPDEDWDKSFDQVLRPALSTTLDKLLVEKSLLVRQLEEARKREEASKAGIPFGMVEIPGGTHAIGINDKDIRRVLAELGHDNESLIGVWRSTPEHQVTLPSFLIDRNEVTNSWYAEFLKDEINADLAKPENLPRFWNKEQGTYPEGFGNRPVTDVSPLNAARFAKWMGRRLVREYEWEAAARLGRSKGELRLWPWGEQWSRTQIICNCDLAFENPARQVRDPKIPPMMPVGSFPEGASFVGLNDLAGNAFEITSSTYAPYPGFKDVKFPKARLTSSDFTQDSVVVRGGDANKRDIVVSTVWRFGLGLTARGLYVGFRTAASTIRGLDQVENMSEGGALRRYLVDIPPLSNDKRDGRGHGILDEKNPAGFTALTMGGFDNERMLPTRARHITVIRRDTDAFTNIAIMQGEAGTTGMVLGILKTDVPILEPKLEPGMYFIQWRNSYVPEPKEGEGESAPEKDPKKPAKPARQGTKKGDGPPPLPDAFEFVRLGGPKGDPLRMETFPPVVIGPDQPLRLSASGAPGNLELRLPFPIRYKKGEAMIFTLNLNVDPATAEQLK